MANAGQAVLTVVGTVVGAYFGYPQLGYALGSLAGQALFPTKLPTVSGPKLADFGQTQSSVGAPIPQGWGACPAVGNIIAKSDVREVIVSEEVGGKGGPTQTTETPTYYQDFAIGFNDGEIAGIRRIWTNGKLIYDRRPQLDDEAESAFTSRMAANDLLDEIMVVYFGTEDQEPDPTLEAFYGVGEVSAFRGLAYVVLANWQNKPEDGNKMPLSWRIEFFTDATVTSLHGTEYSNYVLYPWLAGNPVNPKNAHIFTVHSVGIGDPAGGITGTVVTSVNQGISLVEGFRSKAISKYQGCATSTATLGGIDTGVTDSMGGYTATEIDRINVLLHYNTFDTDNAYSTKVEYGTALDAGGYNECMVAFPGGNVILSDDGFTLVGVFTGTGNKQYKVVSAAEVTTDQGWDIVNTSLCSAFGDNMLESVGLTIGVERVPRGPDNPCAPLDPDEVVIRLPGTNNFAIVDGVLTRCSPWEKITAQAHVMQAYSGTVPVTYPLNPCRPATHAQFNDRTFWEEAYLEQVALGNMAAGLTFGVHYPVNITSYWQREASFETYETHLVPLSLIVHDLCIQAGYAEADFDVTDLAGTMLIGFVRTGPMAARGCIEALRPMAMFDEVEDNGVIKFIKRGKGIVGTVRDEDLGAFYSTDNEGKPVSKITTTKLMDYDIPRQVRLHYLSYDRDYDAGQADSPVRTDTDAVQTVDFDTTVVLTDEAGTQIVQRIWADFWASRWNHTIFLDASAHQYKATDCLAVPVDGAYQRMRIGSIADKLPSIRQFELVRDDSAAFLSYALGQDPPPQLTDVLGVDSPCAAVLLDIPLLRDADDDAGFYAVASPLIVGSTFKGAVLMRSLDGSNYERATQFSSGGIVGTVLTGAQDCDPAVIDRKSELVIKLPSGTLSSKTYAEVLAGANAAAIGVDGRWEIVQWMDAELFGTTTWKLTNLLRGRRGTEHNVATSATNDTFVVLAQAVRVPLDIVYVGKALLYKCVATNQPLDGSDAQTFTGRGVSIKPFSPVFIRGDRDPNTGIWTISWLRRGRIGQTMQSGVDIPLSEEVADYEIEVLDEDENVVRTLSISAETAAYSYENQLVDHGETPDTLIINVYQMSTRIGRGYAGFAMLHAKQPYVGPAGSAPFLAQSGDGAPVPAGYSDGKFILCKKGSKAAIAQIGFYAWTGAGSPTFLGSNYYEDDNIPEGGIPPTYIETVKSLFPYFIAPSSVTFGMYWSFQSAGELSTRTTENRHLYYTTLTGQAPQRVPINTTIITGGTLAQMYTFGGTWYAIMEGVQGTTAAKLYTSSNGLSWTLAGSLSGDAPYFQYSGASASTCQGIFRFNGVTYMRDAFGLLQNVANNLLSWVRIPISEITGLQPSQISNYSIKDLVVNSGSFIVVMEITKSADGLKYNTIITKSLGSPDSFVTTRQIAQASDVPPGLAYDLEWRLATRLGSGGFAVYGVNPFTGSYAQVLTSPDGVSWTSSKVQFGSGLDAAIIINVVSDTTGSRLVATDTVPYLQGGSDSGNRYRFSTSTDGITFTAVPAFP